MSGQLSADERGFLAPLGCLIVSIIVWLCVETPVSQIGWLDPYFYLGLVNNYQDMVARYGTTYYATRISYIAPAMLFHEVLGADSGYIAFRVLVFAGAGALIFSFTRRIYSLHAALIATAWFFFHPAILRGLTWDYMDGYAASCLLVAIMLSIMPTRRPLVLSALAGFAFGCAVDAYPLTLAVGGLAAPVWLWVHWKEGWKRLWPRAAAISAGFIVSFICFIVVQMALSGNGDPIGPVLAIVQSAFSGGAKQWHSNLWTAIYESAGYVLFTPLVAVASLLALRGGTAAKPYPAALTLYVFLVFGMYLVFDQVFQMGAFSNVVATIYLMVPAMLALIVLIGEICARGPRATLIVAIATGICGLLFFAHGLLSQIVAAHFRLTWFMAIAMIALVLMAFRRATVRAAGLAMILVVSPIVYFTSYPLVFGSMRMAHRSAPEWDVRRASLHLQDTIARVVPPKDGAVGFWYKKGPGLQTLDSLQSSHLWAYSRVVNFFNDEPGMPAITPAVKTSLLNKPFVALLGESEAEVTEGLAALQQAGVPYQMLSSEHFAGKEWSYWITIVKVMASAEGNLQFASSIEPKEFKPDHGAVESVKGGVRIQTAKLPYSYGAKLDLTPYARGAKPGVIRVEIEMQRGEAGFALIKADDYSNIVAEKLGRPGIDTIDLAVPDFSQVGALVVRSTDDAVGDWVTVRSITFLEPHKAP